MHQTPLCGHKIAAILNLELRVIAVPIYGSGAGDVQGVGPHSAHSIPNHQLCLVVYYDCLADGRSEPME
jgi:hypothetical protein